MAHNEPLEHDVIKGGGYEIKEKDGKRKATHLV